MKISQLNKFLQKKKQERTAIVDFPEYMIPGTHLSHPNYL